MNKVRIGLIKQVELDDDSVAEYWALGDINVFFNENIETNMFRPRGWKQTLILYRNINSLLNNKKSTGITRVVYIPFWASDINLPNWGNTIIDRIKLIDPFFADAVTFEYEVDETMNMPYEFTNESGKFTMLPDGSVIPETVPEPENTTNE